MKKYLKIENEFYKIENIKDNIIKCFQYNGINQDYTMKKDFFVFDLDKIKNYEFWS